MSRTIGFSVFICFLSAAASMAGPYAPAAGDPESPALAATDSRIVEWASGATVTRGLRRIDDPNSGTVFFGGLDGSPANGAPLGMPPQPQSNFDAVALGQGGMATLTFSHAIFDGPGCDFAVFANGFDVGDMMWCKPAFVEVSSNGADFFRFPAVSLTPSAPQVSSYGQLDPTNLYNLAGKDPLGYGTPFDLAELAGISSLLDIDAVAYVRLVDCVGCIDPTYATYDSQEHIINSPWPAYSAAGSEGFCLAGVGVVNAAPEPSTLAMIVAALAAGAVLSLRRRASFQ